VGKHRPPRSVEAWEGKWNRPLMPFQSALTHIEVGQSEEELCHAAKEKQKDIV
jgi:hypothetical protein